LMGLAILGLAYFTNAAGWRWQTMTFATLAFSRIFLALAMRSERESIITKGVLTNRAMLGAVLLTFVLQLAVIYIPWLQTFLQTQSLSAAELLLSLNIATLGFWIVEAQKLLLRRTRQSPSRSIGEGN
jgi:P-type Ca2+ transporter type 2C